jgi:uncharacterized protein (DUF342 family)
VKIQAEKAAGKAGENPAVQNSATLVPGNKDDGYINISFTENDIEARAELIPPQGNGSPITVDYMAALLEKLNIVHGVLWDDLRQAALECNLNKRPVRDVVIARGQAPVSEVSEYFERNPHLGENTGGRGDAATGMARIDFRSYSPFIIVKKDQVLARLRPRKNGKEGKNVHGVVLPYPVLRPEGVSGGDNTRTDREYIIAEINGQLVENGNVLHVRDSLEIKGPVGYGTGNIIFPGDVIIDGPVSDGFKIYSGGSVTIKQTFDVTDVVTKADLTVAGGIIGRGRALVKVGGNLKTKFIENCRVACRKSITVDAEIINSSVFTMENLDMGDKGIILGGEIYAIHGIRAGGIGKKTGKATQIHCGVDFTVQQEKEKSNSQFRLLAAKIKKLRELLEAGESAGEKRAKMEELLTRLEEERQKLSLKIAGLLGKVNSDENAVVEVSGEIAPGTLIEICQVALFVTEPLRRVKIRLDKISGKLAPEGIQGKNSSSK